jgi:hypothetical protein
MGQAREQMAACNADVADAGAVAAGVMLYRMREE